MPSYRRMRQGQFYFFTLVAYQRRKIFASELARELLHNAIEEVKAESPWQMDAIVLLPDHLHMLWKTPPHDLDYSTRIAVLKKRFTDTFLKAGGRECRVLSGQTRHRRRGVWQERFWEHTIRDLKDYRLHLDYIHSNPVKHGLVELPIEWPWSSFHRYVKQGLYERDWCGHVELPGTVEYLEGF